MNSKRPSKKQMKTIHAKIGRMRKSINDAEKYASKIGILSAANSLNACGAIVDRLLESISDALDAHET